MARTRYSRSALWDPTGTRRLTRAYERDLVKLVALYQKAMITAIEFLAAKAPPHFLEVNLLDRDQVRTLEVRLDPQDITETIEEVGQEIKKRGVTVVDDHVPKAYEAGKRFAAMELGKAGIDVSVSEGRQDLNAADWRTIDWLRARNTSYIKGMTDEMGKKLITTLEEGIRQGEGIPKLERRVRDVTASGKYSAERIARTEHMYAVNQGSLIRYSQHGVTQVKWLAGGDPPRCCDICMDRDGKVYDIHEVPPIPAHPNCRCTTTPVIEIPGRGKGEEKVPEKTGALAGGKEILPKVQAITDKYTAKYRDLNDRLNRYTNQVGNLGEEWQRRFNSAKTDAERTEILNLWDKEYQPKILPLEAERATLIEQIREIRKTGKGEIWDLLSVRPSSKVSYEISKTSKLYKENKFSLDQGFDFFKSVIVSDKYTTAPVKITPIRTGARASASWGGQNINIATKESPSVVIHELGHTLEFREPARLQNALDFYKTRTAGEPLQKLSKVTGTKGYRAGEVTRKDQFMSPYMGKDYQGQATELTSMGLQYLYEKPGELAAKDPDYFVWIVNQARGTF